MTQYDFNNGKHKKHYIVTDQELSRDEQTLLSQLLASFPNSSNEDWPNTFANLNTENTPKKLLLLAANAYDSLGNTVLGVAAEYGRVAPVQRLIDMGAKLDVPDHHMDKSAIYWAIDNQLSSHNLTSFKAVEVLKYLLKRGADPELACYNHEPPLEYAKKRGFKAAAIVIARAIKRRKWKTPPSLFQLCLFKIKETIESEEMRAEDMIAKFPENIAIPEPLEKLFKKYLP